MSNATPVHSGGLLGAFKRAGGLFQDPSRVIVRLAMLAAVLTIASHAGIPIPYAAACIAIILGLSCLFAEAFTATGGVDAFWYGRPLGALGYTALWCAAFGYAMMNWVGTASETEAEKSNIHKALHYASVDTRKSVTEKEANLVRAKEERALMKPVRSLPVARAAMDGAMAKWQWEASAKCTKAAPKTRKFCDDYRAAEADLRLWDQINLQEAKIDNLQAELDAARATAANTKVETSDERNDLKMLASFLDVPVNVASNIAAVWQTAVLSILISLTTILRRLDELRQKGGRVRMHLGFKVRRFFARLFLGRDPANTVVQYNGTLNGISREDILAARPA